MSIDFTLLSEYIFLKNKCSALTACSNYPLSASATRGKSHMTHVVFGVAGFFFLQSVFTILSISNNFGLIILLNQSFRVSILNFNSIEKSSARAVHFFSTKDSRSDIFQLSKCNVITKWDMFRFKMTLKRSYIS